MRICVLGGTSKVWRAMAPFCALPQYAEMDWTTYGRRAAPGIDVVLPSDAPLSGVRPADIVLALWGITTGPETSLAQNTVLARHAQQVAGHIGARGVLHAGTGAVYAPSNDPLRESAKIDPRHPYGQAKWAAEQAVLNAEPRSLVLRLGNVVGTDALAQAAERQPRLVLDRFPNGTFPQRSYIAPDTLLGVIAHLAQSEVATWPPVLNVAGPEPVSMDALLHSANIPFDVREAPQEALARQHLDVDALTAFGSDLRKSSDVSHLATFMPKRRMSE